MQSSSKMDALLSSNMYVYDVITYSGKNNHFYVEVRVCVCLFVCMSARASTAKATQMARGAQCIREVNRNMVDIGWKKI